MRLSTVFIEFPWLALIPAALLSWLWIASHATAALVAALLWFAYTAWEYVLRHVDPGADIRVDLLLIYPLLLIVTVAALWFGFRKGSS